MIKVKTAFLGPLTSFSHQAALKAFSKAELEEMHSIHGVFTAVLDGSAEYGVVPVENSTEGSVNSTLDLLLESSLFIRGEIFIDVNHCLIAKKGTEKIEKIYSHPQAFGQCEKWIRKNYPKAELIGASSTSSAAVHAAANGNSAAIASKETAERFGLKVISKNIQDLSFNKTRFLIIGKEQAKPSKTNKTTLFFALKDRAGALFDCLKGFKDFNVSLTRLESRPSKKGAWEYVFFTEFQGDQTDENVRKALEELKEHTNSVKILGSYSKIGD